MTHPDLSAALGADLPEIDGLDPHDAERLATLVVAAKERQARELDEAIDAGMRHIPRLLRGTVKAALFPVTTDIAATDVALAKLARTMDIDVDEVAFLAHLDVEALRELRRRVSDAMSAADAGRLHAVVAASAFVPVRLAATIGEHWFGPVLCARLVGLIDPRRGGQFAKHLSVGFMADLTARADPRVVGDLVHELDLKVMQRIATTLLERGDHITLSDFVGHLPPSVVAAILEAIDDNAAVVRIARYVEDPNSLDPVVALLPDDRIVELVRAVDAEDLWVDGLDLFSHLGDTQMTRIAVTIARQDSDAVAAALDAFDRHGLWEQGLTLVDHLDPADVVAVSDVLLELDDQLVDTAVEVIERTDSWLRLVRIAVAAGELGEPERARLREIVDRLPAEQVSRFEAAAVEAGHPGLLEAVLDPNRSETSTGG